eukprot:6343911-Amphidinium_carterae.1
MLNALGCACDPDHSGPDIDRCIGLHVQVSHPVKDYLTQRMRKQGSGQLPSATWCAVTPSCWSRRSMEGSHHDQLLDPAAASPTAITLCNHFCI